jgi:hypothetical protein
MGQGLFRSVSADQCQGCLHGTKVIAKVGWLHVGIVCIWMQVPVDAQQRSDHSDSGLELALTSTEVVVHDVRVVSRERPAGDEPLPLRSRGWVVLPRSHPAEPLAVMDSLGLG